jgi:hypothetical protein
LIRRTITTLLMLGTVTTATAALTPAAHAAAPAPPPPPIMVSGNAQSAAASVADPPSASEYAPSDACYTISGTAYGDDRVGAHLTSFTLNVWYCVHKTSTTLGPVYNWVYWISKAWSPAVTDQHVDHHVFSIASLAGWSYVGLDSSGNWGPTITTGKGLTVQRRAHFHLHFGVGWLATNQDGYLTVRIELGPNGTGTVYTSAST